MTALFSNRIFRLVMPVAVSAWLFFIGTGAESAKGAGARRPAAGGGGLKLQTPEPRTPLEHNNRGVELGSKGLWPQAIEEHEKALAGDPYNKDFRTNLSAAQLRYGDILLSRNDFYNAIKQYRGALYVDPSNVPADEHLDDCLRKLKKNSDDMKVRRQMAEVAETSGDFETAIVEFRKCVKMTDDGPSHANLARVVLKAGKVVDGFDELTVAVAKPWPDDKKNDQSEAHRQLGDILKEYAQLAFRKGRPADGVKRLVNAGIAYRRAVTLNPSNMDAGRSLVEVARHAVDMNPVFDNYLTLAGGYQLIGDFERAKLTYEKAWRSNASSPVLPIARKSFYRAVVKSPLASPVMLAETLQKVQEALNRNPQDAELWYIFGRGKEAQQDTEAAMEAYQKAAAIKNPRVDADVQAAIKRLGGALPAPKKEDPEAVQVQQTALAEAENKLSAGQVDEAQKQLQATVEKNPRLGRAWLLLGVTYEKKGDLEQSAVAYRQAAYLKEPGAEAALRQISASRIQPMLEEGEKAAKEGNWVKAAASYREAAVIAPHLPIVHRRLAEALRQLGDTKEADSENKRADELEKERT